MTDMPNPYQAPRDGSDESAVRRRSSVSTIVASILTSIAVLGILLYLAFLCISWLIPVDVYFHDTFVSVDVLVVVIVAVGALSIVLGVGVFWFWRTRRETAQIQGDGGAVRSGAEFLDESKS
ncbi:MAG: hypothetical protein AB8G99_15870 [Planctomycetaceae bacterium]